MKGKQYTYEELADVMPRYTVRKDCFIAVTGEEGDGKSVLARLFVRRQYMKHLKAKLNLDEVMYFGKDTLKNIMEETERRIYIHDEAVDNLRRTWYEANQIQFVKMLNLIRDHHHILYLCWPRFLSLDQYILDRVRFHIWIKKSVSLDGRDGIAFIFKKKTGAFVKDPWNVKLNEQLTYRSQIEKSPNYHGWFRVPYIDKPWFNIMEEEAKSIKDIKRREIVQVDKQIVDTSTCAQLLIRLKKHIPHGNQGKIITALGLKPNSVRETMNQHNLKNETISIVKDNNDRVGEESTKLTQSQQ